MKIGNMKMLKITPSLLTLFIVGQTAFASLPPDFAALAINPQSFCIFDSSLEHVDATSEPHVLAIVETPATDTQPSELQVVALVKCNASMTDTPQEQLRVGSIRKLQISGEFSGGSLVPKKK